MKLKECMKGENSSFVRFTLYSANTKQHCSSQHRCRCSCRIRSTNTSGSDEVLCDSKETEKLVEKAVDIKKIRREERVRRVV